MYGSVVCASIHFVISSEAVVQLTYLAYYKLVYKHTFQTYLISQGQDIALLSRNSGIYLLCDIENQYLSV